MKAQINVIEYVSDMKYLKIKQVFTLFDYVIIIIYRLM